MAKILLLLAFFRTNYLCEAEWGTFGADAWSQNWEIRHAFPSPRAHFNCTPHVLHLRFVSSTVIIHRVVAHEDPPFRPNIRSMDMKPEYIELMVDCWNDEPEERPHFYRIVERLKKISGR